MPKGVFRCAISNNVLKRKLFWKRYKSKINRKNSGKFVWIDGSIKKDWRYLKSKYGIRTDRLFLYYLLRLAERDLFNIRNIFNNKEGENENNSPHQKLSVNNEDSSDLSWEKWLAQHLEKEKKIEPQNLEKDKINIPTKICTKNVDDSFMEKEKANISRVLENKTLEKEIITIKDTQGVHYKNKGQVQCGKKSCKLKPSKISGDCSSQNTALAVKQLIKSKSVHPEENEKANEINYFEDKMKNVIDKIKNDIKNTEDIQWTGCKTKKIGVKKYEKIINTCTCESEHPGNDIKSENETKNREACKNSHSINISEGEILCDFQDSEERENFINENLNEKERNSEESLNSVSSGNHKWDKNSGGLNSVVKYSVESLCFARITLPEYLFFKTVNVDHGLSVFTKVFVKRGTQFGPLIGHPVKEMDIRDDVNMKDIWEIQLVDRISYISTQDEEASNWLRYLRPAENKESANLFTSVKEYNLYFDVVKDIEKGEELVYWSRDTHQNWIKKKFEKKTCGGCNIQFAHTLYYRKHCLIFHDPKVSLTLRKYHCKICGLAVLGKEKFIKHAIELHEGKGAYQCQYCLKYFLRLNYLGMHKNYGCSENPQRSRPLCDLCGRKFCQPQKLKAHIKRMHSDMTVVLRDFQCKNCQKILSSRAALQRHLREVHNRSIIKSFACDRCGKIFQNKSNLKIHLLTHSGVKPFKCQETKCQAAFTTKQCLKLHYKRIHKFSDEVMPKIERSVAYTFDAYSGNTVSDPDGCEGLSLDNQDTSGEKQSLSSSSSEDSNLIIDLEEEYAHPESRKKILPNKRSPSSSEDSNLIIDLDEESPESGKKMKKDAGSTHPESGVVPDDDSRSQSGLNETINEEKKSWRTCSSPDKVDLSHATFKENRETCAPVEVAANPSGKDSTETSFQTSSKSVVSDEAVESHSGIYSYNPYENNPSVMMWESNLKKAQPYESPSLETSKEKTDFGESFKCNNFLRMNAPFGDVQRDSGLVIFGRDEEEIETQGDVCASGDAIRTEGFTPRRGEEGVLRSPPTGVKFDYGDVGFSNEYRSLEKNRNLDLGGLRLTEKVCEGYGRTEEAEAEGVAENLCVKEKSCHCENLEEMTKLNREGSGFEIVFGNEATGGPVQNPNLGVIFRSPLGVASPRSYHPAFESESVDFSVRPSFCSSPVYTLDLTPSRHLDFRGPLGLPPLRFCSSTSGMTDGDSPQITSTGYGIYQPSYGVPAHQGSEFQPYAPLYY